MATATADMEQMLGMQGAAPAPTQPMMAPASADMMGGIGSLPMTEEEPTMPDGGLASAIERLQSFGRSGDELIAHMTPGELVVPADILKQNPEVQEMIFAEMRLAGIEDPESYIVGSGANSINPETGLPEFFFKKVFRSVKKAVKSVAKVVKKAAPLIIPLAINMVAPGLGAIASGALGAGIGTLVQGGDLKDAFKSALIGGAMGGLYKGIGAGFDAYKGGASFGDAFRSGTQAIGKDLSGFQQTLQSGDLLKGGIFDSSAGQAMTTPVKESGMGTPEADVTQATEMATSASGQPATVDQTLDIARSGGQPLTPKASSGMANLYDDPNRIVDLTSPEGFVDYGQLTPPTAAPTTAPAQINYATSPNAAVSQQLADARTLNAVADPQRSFLQKTGDYMFRGGQSPADIEAARQAAGQSYIASRPAQFQTAAGYESAMSSAGPSMLERFGPSVAAGTALAYGSGFFDTPPPPEPYDAFEGQTRYFDMTPEERAQYRIADLSSGPGYSDPYITESPYQLQNPRFQPLPFYQPVRYAARGGEMSPDYFPRRMGAIAGPGTETSDDVPAMLSDGEFVMTAKAVRGAGNGSRQRGIKTMYDMMSQFERSVA